MLQWFREVASAVAAMHTQRILHRDVKLANCFLDAHGTVKLGDFGLASTLPSDADHLEEACGTVTAMAPELLASPPRASAASDVWALGTVLYELSALTPAFSVPFDSFGIDIQRLRSALKRPIPPTPPGHSEHLRGLVCALCQKEWAERPSAEAVVTTLLRAWPANAPQPPPRPSAARPAPRRASAKNAPVVRHTEASAAAAACQQQQQQQQQQQPGQGSQGSGGEGMAGGGKKSLSGMEQSVLRREKVRLLEEQRRQARQQQRRQAREAAVGAAAAPLFGRRADAKKKPAATSTQGSSRAAGRAPGRQLEISPSAPSLGEPDRVALPPAALDDTHAVVSGGVGGGRLSSARGLGSARSRASAAISRVGMPPPPAAEVAVAVAAAQ
eukprot:COSAG01_NODE_1136_length_11548_cov_30.375404_8_plen_386_part_00